MQIGGRDIGLIDLAKRVGEHVSRDNVSILATALAYRFFLAMFPFFIFVTALGGFIAAMLNIQNPADQLVGFMGNVPAGVADVVSTQLQDVLENQRPGLLSFGILGAIFAATAGMNAIIKSMNLAYDVEETRPWWKKFLLGIGLTLLAGTFLLISFVLLVAGPFIGGQLAEMLGLGGVWQAVVDVVRWAIAITLLLVATWFIYWASPNIDMPWRWVWPGTVLFAVGWLVTTLLFAFYVMNFGEYNATYGALGGVVVALTWFYLTAFILLLGAELNAVINEHQDPGQVEGQRRAKQQETERERPERRDSEKDRRLAA
jgi:membrane protein